MTGAAPTTAAKGPPVTPLDPNSAKGREVAQRLGEVFAEVREAIAARKAREAIRQQTSP